MSQARHSKRHKPFEEPQADDLSPNHRGKWTVQFPNSSVKEPIFWNQIDDPLHTNFTFKLADGTNTRVHSAVLANYEYFQMVWRANMSERKKMAMMLPKWVDIATLNAFLWCIYSNGSIPRDIPYPEADLGKLWALFDMYNMDKYRFEMTTYFVKPNNVSEVLKFYFSYARHGSALYHESIKVLAAPETRMNDVSLEGIIKNEAETIIRSLPTGLRKLEFIAQWEECNPSEDSQSLLRLVDIEGIPYSDMESVKDLCVLSPNDLISALIRKGG